MNQYSKIGIGAGVVAALVVVAFGARELLFPPAPPPPPPAPVVEAPPPPPAPPPIPPGSPEDFAANVPDPIVHFAFDRAGLDEASRVLLDQEAAWLVKYPRAMVTIEGHTDQRGSAEYNLALGERRAATVKDYLVDQGVGAERIETVSYGLQRLLCTDSDESCWSRNRRAVTVIRNPNPTVAAEQG